MLEIMDNLVRGGRDLQWLSLGRGHQLWRADGSQMLVVVAVVEVVVVVVITICCFQVSMFEGLLLRLFCAVRPIYQERKIPWSWWWYGAASVLVR